MATARSASLAWNPNNEPDLAGYRIHFGTISGIYSESIDVGLTATPATPAYVLTYPFTNVVPLMFDWPVDGKWYFVVTAYNTSNLESPASNEVSKSIPLQVLQATRMG